MIRKALVLAACMLALGDAAVWACSYCRPTVNADVYNRYFADNLLVLLLPLAVLSMIGIALHFSDEIVDRMRRRGRNK